MSFRGRGRRGGGKNSFRSPRRTRSRSRTRSPRRIVRTRSRSRTRSPRRSRSRTRSTSRNRFNKFQGERSRFSRGRDFSKDRGESRENFVRRNNRSPIQVRPGPGNKRRSDLNSNNQPKIITVSVGFDDDNPVKQLTVDDKKLLRKIQEENQDVSIDLGLEQQQKKNVISFKGVAAKVKRSGLCCIFLFAFPLALTIKRNK